MHASVVLGRDQQTGDLLELSQQARRQGLYMIGVNGTGKSTLIASLIEADMQQGYGLCLLDPHGDLTASVLSRVPEERLGDVILLDLFDSAYPFGLNLFECPNPDDTEAVALTAAFVMHVFEKVWDVGPETPQLAQVLRNVTFTLIQNPGTTLAEAPLLLQDETARAKLIARVSNPQVRLFWQTYDKLRPNDQLERAASTLNKVDAFLTQPIIANIVGQSHTTLDFRRIMDEGKILLVQLSPRLEDLSMLVGAVIIGQLLSAALGRQDTPERERRQFNLYADEYQRFATEDFAALLSEARKFGLATTVAHQYLDQLDFANRGAAVNAANLVVFRVSGQDAGELAKEFDATPPPPPVIGQRPILTPKQDILDHLVKSGHRNETVAKFARDYLRRFVDECGGATRHFSDVRLRIEHFAFLKAGIVANAFSSLHRLLYDAMAEKKLDVEIPPDVLVLLAGQTPPTRNAITRLISFHTSGTYRPHAHLAFLTRPDFEAYEAEVRDEVFSGGFRQSKHEEITREWEALYSLVLMLRQTMQALADDPVLIDTGQHEPIYDRPRTYQDVQNEISSRLANLANYEARAKTLGGERLIVTLPPSQAVTESELVSRRAQVVEQTRTHYCRPRQEVEEEMLKRQQALLTPVPAATPTRRGPMKA